LDSGSKYNDL